MATLGPLSFLLVPAFTRSYTEPFSSRLALEPFLALSLFAVLPPSTLIRLCCLFAFGFTSATSFELCLVSEPSFCPELSLATRRLFVGSTKEELFMRSTFFRLMDCAPGCYSLSFFFFVVSWRFSLSLAASPVTWFSIDGLNQPNCSLHSFSSSFSSLLNWADETRKLLAIW